MRKTRLALLGTLIITAAAPRAWSGEYDFDVGRFEKKPFEWGGYAELKAESFRLDPDAAGYLVNFADRTDRGNLQRGTATVELDGRYRHGATAFNLRTHTAVQHDALQNSARTRLYEGYGAYEPRTGLRFEAGKRALRWGKGYAWNPVGFVERPKDPNEPELAREGYVMAGIEAVRSFPGSLQTVSLSALIVPVNGDINEDFGSPGHVNPAARLYLLYRDTDIDLMILGRGSRGPRVGADFSRNLLSNLEVHGEWAYVRDQPTAVVSASGALLSERRSLHSYLFGIRYLTAGETTWIAEYYHNGGGYSGAQMDAFYSLARDAFDAYRSGGGTALLQPAQAAATRGYLRANPMRDYLYLRASNKEPFDILYFTPSVTAIVNLGDHSWSLTPELLYTRYRHLELRARLTLLHGASATEFAEKQNDAKLELRVRYFF